MEVRVSIEQTLNCRFLDGRADSSHNRPFLCFDTGYDIVGAGAVLTGRVVTVTVLAGSVGSVTLLFLIKYKEGTYERDGSCLTNIH